MGQRNLEVTRFSRPLIAQHHLESPDDVGFRNLEVAQFRNRLTAQTCREHTDDVGHRDFRFRNLEVTGPQFAAQETLP